MEERIIIEVLTRKPFCFLSPSIENFSLGGGAEGATDKRKENKPTTFFFYTETTSFLHYLGWFPCNS